MNKLQQLAELGQAIWLDYIRRSFLTSGQLAALVQEGLRGVTSNPSIFEKAIAGSSDYDAQLASLAGSEEPVEAIYEALALEDIRMAADALRPVYDATEGLDGYVSLEVSPSLARDTAGTIATARRLFQAVGRPNVMIKVPATVEGFPAIEALIAEGINVNVTLIFSPAHYEPAAEAYLAGLEKLAAAGGNLSRVASVASFFVSRMDTAVDRELEALQEKELQGKIAVANAKVAYARFRELLQSARWRALAARGARPQRLLWASTSTKNPNYPDTLYVDSLIGPDTVNTLPPTTLDAFRDHGAVALTVTEGLDEARAQLGRLEELGVDLAAITEKLQEDGLAAFARSFEGLLASIAEKRARLVAGWECLTAELASYRAVVDAALARMEEERTIARLWAHDHIVWKPHPDEITNRLGWLHSADQMGDRVDEIQALVETVRAEGYSHALLLGMGGSSLAPEVLRKTFGLRQGYLDLEVLDSTDPAAVRAHDEALDMHKTLFIVATKSGGTVETLSFFRYFYTRVADELGVAGAGAHFVAITDPGSELAELATKYAFRATFLNDPNIGGRYSALSFFGLVPAALVGIDIRELLERAQRMARNCEGCNCLLQGDNNGGRLGTMMGVLARQGRDKLTLVTSAALASFGDWVEQLIAESTGKEGTGILPVVGEPLGAPEVYGDDRFFVHLRLEGDDADDAILETLVRAGHPVARLRLRDLYDLGAQFFLWEMATAVAGHHLNVNPFDQPNVEASKALARELVATYRQTGALPRGEIAPLSAEALRAFLAPARPGDYVALHAWVQPTPQTDAALQVLRLRLRDRTRLATTVGYGPRFLHSTGQLHKGDAGKGLFIQLLGDSARDVPIPDEPGLPEASLSFGVLKRAQALGDRQALLERGRRVITLDVGQDVVGALQRLLAALE